MASKIPASFKSLTPFIRRAEELDRDRSRAETKLVAFYCRQYAMEIGIPLREKDPSDEATEYLLSLMESLENEKKLMPHFSMEEGKQICETFAFEVFCKADDEDRSGAANKNTARTFYAAGTFFDILKQFGPLDEDIIEKARYSKWKAAEILKAIKEGRQPTPGAPGENIDAPLLDFPEMTNSSSGDATTTMQLPSPPSDVVSSSPSSSLQDFPNLSVSTRIPPSAPSNVPSRHIPSQPHDPSLAYTHSMYSDLPMTTPSNILPSPPTYSDSRQYQGTRQDIPRRNGAITQEAINDAMEYAKFAVGALKVKEVEVAIERLEKALSCLR